MQALLISFLCLLPALLQGHGFTADTLIFINQHNNELKYIDQLTVGTAVTSHREYGDRFRFSSIKKIGIHRTNIIVQIAVGTTIITTTPDQLLLCDINADEMEWKCAVEITDTDCLHSMYGPIPVEGVHIYSKPTTIYQLSVGFDHTFCITEYGIVVHNFATEIGSTVIRSAAISALPVTLEAAAATATLTPMGAVVLGAVGTACLAYGVVKLIHYCKQNDNQTDNNILYAEKAPGKPTADDGFIPKKGWDGKKVKHPRGYGWPDKKGNIWIPTGEDGHGGPHWDVQHPDGSYENIVPGGKIRGQK